MCRHIAQCLSFHTPWYPQCKYIKRKCSLVHTFSATLPVIHLSNSPHVPQTPAYVRNFAGPAQGWCEVTQYMHLDGQSNCLVQQYLHSSSSSRPLHFWLLIPNDSKFNLGVASAAVAEHIWRHHWHHADLSDYQPNCLLMLFQRRSLLARTNNPQNNITTAEACLVMQQSSAWRLGNAVFCYPSCCFLVAVILCFPFCTLVDSFREVFMYPSHCM